MVIGICGGSGSGKTTLVKQLEAQFYALKPALFSLDNYYKPPEQLALDQNGTTNFDLPSALDKNQLISDFESLLNGNSIQVKEYMFNVENADSQLLTIQSSKLIIVEGLFLFNYPNLIDKVDFIIFIDLPLNVQLDRRIKRDVKQRGYALEDVIYQWENHVVPCYSKSVLPNKEKADFIYHSDERSKKEFIQLISEIDRILAHA